LFICGVVLLDDVLDYCQTNKENKKQRKKRKKERSKDIIFHFGQIK